MKTFRAPAPRAMVIASDPETRLLIRRALARAGVEASFHAETPDDAALARVDMLVLGAGASRGRSVARAVAERGGRVVSVVHGDDGDSMGAQAIIRGPLSIERLICAIAQAVGRGPQRSGTEQRRREAALV